MSEGLRFKDKVVIVTGGSKGIGEGCVRVFVKHGGKVVFCARGKEAGEKLQKELNEVGPGEALFVPCDVTKSDEIEAVVETAVSRFGNLHCLINNAGWHPPFNTIDNFSEEDFRDLFELNVVSYFTFCKKSLPHLRKTKGSIINMSSLVNTLGQKGAVTYCATKGAISAMTRSLAIDEARHGVRVNTVSPGNVWTPLWHEGAMASGNYEEAVSGGNNSQLTGRMGTLEESGEMCLFLAAEGSFCTGIDLNLSGGAELGYGNKNQTLEGKTAYN